MTTKKPEEATYFIAGNSSRIREKIFKFILKLILYRWLIVFCPNVVDIICFEQAVQHYGVVKYQVLL